MNTYEKKEYEKKKRKINKLYLVNSWENVRGNNGSLAPFEVCRNDKETITIVSAKLPGLKTKTKNKHKPANNHKKYRKIKNNRLDGVG